MLNDGTTNLVYGHARIRRGTGTWYQHDGLGSVRAVLDGAGAVQSTTSYDPWGTPQTALTDSFGFTGELQFGEQVHLRARWYNTNLGTFTARDPFAGFDTQPYSLHPYQYAYSNPVLLTDPSGAVAGTLTVGTPLGAAAAAACAASVVCGIVAGVVVVTAVVGTAYMACQNEVLICQDEVAPTSQQRIDAGAAPAPPRHTGNHTPAPVTPPSAPHPAPQEPSRESTIHSTPWGMDESLVCTQEGFPLPEAEDFKVTIFPAPQEGKVPVLTIGELPLFDREGILYTKHFPDELNNDNISEEEALDTFLNGKKYESRFGDAIVYKAIPGQPNNGVTMVVSKSERKAITAWRGDEKRSWRRGWPYMTWYP